MEEDPYYGDVFKAYIIDLQYILVKKEMNLMIEQRTDEWFLQRKGKITSSEVAAIIGKGKSLPHRQDIPT